MYKKVYKKVYRVIDKTVIEKTRCVEMKDGLQTNYRTKTLGQKYGGGPWAARSISDYPYLNDLQRLHTLGFSLANLHVSRSFRFSNK